MLAAEWMVTGATVIRPGPKLHTYAAEYAGDGLLSWRGVIPSKEKGKTETGQSRQPKLQDDGATVKT